MRLIVAQGMRPAAIGIIFGLGVAAGAARALDTLLFETDPMNARTFGAMAAALGAASLAACVLPSWRALRLDPAKALRTE